jgi:protein-tyrosine phosphatase
VTETFRVLFVCTANQCRSAMAQAIAQDELRTLGVTGLEFASAGTRALAGSPATDGTVLVLGERGIDLATHRASELDASVLAGADLVLALAAEHTDMILAWERSASRRTFTLGGFVRAAAPVVRWAGSPDELVDLANEHREELADDDVLDPVGLGEEAYRQCAERLDELVRSLVRSLAKVASPSTARSPSGGPRRP